MARSHVDLTGYPHTACIHLIACLVDGRSYTLLACSRACIAFLDGFLGCHCPHRWMSGIRYRPWSLRTPMWIGFPLHMISTSCSLYTCIPSLVKIEIVPSSAVFPTLISNVGKLWNVSADLAFFDRVGKGSCVTDIPLHFALFSTPTRLSDGRNIRRPAAFLSDFLI